MSPIHPKTLYSELNARVCSLLQWSFPSHIRKIKKTYKGREISGFEKLERLCVCQLIAYNVKRVRKQCRPGSWPIERVNKLLYCKQVVARSPRLWVSRCLSDAFDNLASWKVVLINRLKKKIWLFSECNLLLFFKFKSRLSPNGRTHECSTHIVMQYIYTHTPAYTCTHTYTFTHTTL